MISLQSFHEVEELIKDGQHRRARHLIRDILGEFRLHFHEADEQAAIVKGLLSDTLDMLLLFSHESQITLNSIRAARMLARRRDHVAPQPAEPRWSSVCG